MNTYRYTPEIIEKEKLNFSIPLYQRLFTWDTDQVKGLLFDLKNHFDSDDNSPYYLGMLSCISDENDSNSYSLIDGQQRFTVINLMAIAFLNGNYCESDNWNLFLKEGKRLHFIARSTDNEYLKNRIFRHQAQEVNEKMENGIKVITEFMINEFTSDDDRNKFSTNVFKRLSFFFSELPSSYTRNPASLNKYFEAMNATGKGLEQHEILKVELMKNQDNKDFLTRIWNTVSDMDRPVIKKNSDEPEEKYREKYESAISLCRDNKFHEALEKTENSYDAEDDSTIDSIEAKQNQFNHLDNNAENRSLSSFPDFLKLVIVIHLDLKDRYSFYRKELINIFNENKNIDIPGFYNKLLFFRLLLDYYIIHKEGDETTVVHDIIYKKGKATDCLKQYQSMVYVSQTPFYNWIKPLIIKLSRQVVQDSKELLNWIKEIDNKQHPLPSNFEDMRYDNGIDRYWFWRLDYYLWEKREELFENENEREIVDDYKFRTNRSIEHLHPQHQAHNEEWQVDDIHSFGNLAMISQSFNSEQSDDPVLVKFARISEQAKNHNLQSIKLYRMYLDSNMAPTGWSKEIKDSHQNKMLELLVNSYKS